MRVVSLYCGAGGMDEGLKQVGIKTSVAVDSDPAACETMRANHPDADVLCGTVEDWTESIGRADMVIGGPPCPEFSTANTKRTGDPSEVNRFWGIVWSSRAKHWIMENVRGVQAVLGHRTDGRLVNCADYGVPQTRIRMIYSNLPVPPRTHSRAGGQATLFGGRLEKWVSVSQALGLDCIQWHNENAGKTYRAGKPSYTVLAQDPRLGICIEDRSHPDGWRQYPADRPAIVLQTDTRLFVVNRTNRGSGNDSRTRPADAPAETVTTQNKVWIKADRDAEYADKKCKTRHPSNRLVAPAGTVVAKDYSHGSNFVTDGRYERRLTLPELAKLQGFPDGYLWRGNKGQRMRQIGNAVPPPVIKAYAAALLEVPVSA